MITGYPRSFCFGCIRIPLNSHGKDIALAGAGRKVGDGNECLHPGSILRVPVPAIPFSTRSRVYFMLHHLPVAGQ